jgi:hypothetical protein
MIKLWTVERRISDGILCTDNKYMVLQYREVDTIQKIELLTLVELVIARIK